MKEWTTQRWLAVSGLGALGVVVWFVAMKVAFGLEDGGTGALLFGLAGMACFLLWLASAVAVVAGLIGALVTVLKA